MDTAVKNATSVWARVSAGIFKQRKAMGHHKVEVKNLFKVFGNQPEKAMSMVRSGTTKDELFQRTGMVLGVKDASFEVRQGEIFVLMGLSGSGKSTLIRLLNRLIEPTAGEVWVDGQDVAKLEKKALIDLRRKDMAMVFQSFALLPHLSVLGNAAFGLEVAGFDSTTRERRAMQVLEQVGLQAFAHKRTSELSGGMQQRVGLARALAVDPSLMLMDEAFSALDPLKRTEMQDLLLQIQREQQRTIVFVSHDLDEAFKIGNRIAIMEGGRVVQVGTPDEILRNPSEDYVKAFFKGVDTKKYFMAKDLAEPVDTISMPTSVSSQTLETWLNRMISENQSELFVTTAEGQLLGVARQTDIEQALSQGTVANWRAAALPVCLKGEVSMADLGREVVKATSAVPVVDDQHRLLGVITKGGLLARLIEQEA
jgi:glycine betaine/proline transport system ATP-binding protein